MNANEFIVDIPLNIGRESYAVSFESRDHDFEFSSGCCMDTFVWTPLKRNVSWNQSTIMWNRHYQHDLKSTCSQSILEKVTIDPWSEMGLHQSLELVHCIHWVKDTIEKGLVEHKYSNLNSNCNFSFSEPSFLFLLCFCFLFLAQTRSLFTAFLVSRCFRPRFKTIFDLICIIQFYFKARRL